MYSSRPCILVVHDPAKKRIRKIDFDNPWELETRNSFAVLSDFEIISEVNSINNNNDHSTHIPEAIKTLGTSYRMGASAI